MSECRCHRWVSPWAAPVQPCLLGCLSFVTFLVQLGCWEGSVGALGMRSLTGTLQGPNFRDNYRGYPYAVSPPSFHSFCMMLQDEVSACMTDN